MSDLAEFKRFRQDRTADIQRRIEDDIAAREHEVFERTTESGLCKVAVNLRGRLVSVVFLKNNVMRITDRETLAEEITATVTAAQREAADEVAAIVARISEAAQ